MMQKKIIKICSVIIGISGVIIIITTLYPIFSYEWSAEQKYPKLLSPVVDEEKASFTFSNKDYTKIYEWFDESGAYPKEYYDDIKFYTLSIPSLKINDAIVRIGGSDLSGSLIQYYGTALPGNIGNPVIFGHSVLPQFFDPENYLTIFSTLPRIEKGDEVYISFEGKNYTYQVRDIFEVSPKDVQILNQEKSDSYLTLVTCTPPGHPLKPKRLVVKAILVEVS